MRKATIAIIAIIAVSFLIGIYLYPKMPYDMASHWNAAGEVDGYISKFWGLFLMPIISLAMLLLFLLLPMIDPLKKNVETFRKYYDGFIGLMTAFLFYIYLLTIFWNIGYRFNMLIWLTPSFAVLFYYAGMLMQHAKRNWFIGIKTPWTLSSDDVWDKTHKLGAKLFKATAAVCLLGMVLPNYAIWFVLVPVIATAIATMVYSYVVYRKQGKKNH
jgi:uncharacterized membrane protein